MAYNPATNGLTEAFNKIIIKIFKKLVRKTSVTSIQSLANASGLIAP